MRKNRIISILLSLVLIGSIIVLPASVTGAATYTYANQAEKYATYSGNDLGASYSKTSTTFKVWAPSATKVLLNRYAKGSSDEAGDRLIESVDMSKDSTSGVWAKTIQGDIKNTYYTYTVTAPSVSGAAVTNETQDVYSVATGVNGKRSMVTDLDSTDPEGWSSDKHQFTKNQTDAVVWEVQIRDFSISDTSGVADKYKGKYLAFTQSGTKVNGSNDISTCVDYLVQQGVNYVHLNPVYDFATVDETRLDKPQYNWGYDPENYNVPEGSYSTDPYNGEVRIKEFKQMVQALHDRGIGVVMDVVYNHVNSAPDSCFEKTVPGYYFRLRLGTNQYHNSSGCGNVTASDKVMYRKYMVDSVKYWVNEYHIDGFRFDLMGCHDIETMNKIRTELDKIDSRILMYGEPWTADGGDNGLSGDLTANFWSSDGKNPAIDNLNSRIAIFNDSFRDTIKGSTDGSDGKYIQGNTYVVHDIKAGMMGRSSSTWSGSMTVKAPEQTVTYQAAHDNLTIWDKIVKSNSMSGQWNSTSSTLIAQNKLGAALVLTSQGIAFTLAGEEFARTKQGDHNSYKSPDNINQLDWTRVNTYKTLVDYYKGLTKIRMNYSPMRDNTNTTVNKTWFNENGGAVGYTMQNSKAGEWGTVAVLVNNETSAKNVKLTLNNNGTGVNLANKTWVVVANGSSAGLTSLGTMTSNSSGDVSVPARTALVLVEKASFDSAAVKERDFKTITVQHINESTGDILKTTTSPHEVGSTYRVSADADLLFDYSNTKVEGNVTGTVTSNATVKFYYNKVGTSYTLTTKYVDASGKELYQTQTTKLRSGENYIAPIQTISGYELDTSKFPMSAVGTISKDTTVTYTYKELPAEKLKIHFKDTAGWGKPFLYAYDDSSGTAVQLTGKWPGSAMTAEGDGWYTYPEINISTAKVIFTNAAGTAQYPGANESGFEARGEVWYEHPSYSFSAQVKVTHLDKNGNKLCEDVVIDGTKVSSSDTYTTKPIASGGDVYTVVGAETGKWSSGVKNVVYIYGIEGGVRERYMLGNAYDSDEKISMADILAIQKIIAYYYKPTTVQKLSADVTQDGKISMADALTLQRYIVRLPVSYPIGQWFDVPLDIE